MKHHPVLAFLLILVFGPYIAALIAIVAVLWLLAMAVALPFTARRA